jgi:PAS domain S-box-containing protein
LNIYKDKFNTGYFLVIVSLITAYFLAGKISLDFAFLNKSVSPFWLPTGISITAFLFLGYRIWPAIFIGAFLLNSTTAGTITTSLGIAAGNTLEGAAALYFINKFFTNRNIFETPVNILKYTLFVGIISTLISAAIGVTSLSLGGFIQTPNLLDLFLTWWIGDIGGALVIGSFLILWITDHKIDWSSKKIIEAAALLFLIITTSFIIFVDPSFVSIKIPLIIERYPYLFMTFPLILLVAFRFDLRETSTVVIIFYLIALVGITNGSYRMASDNPNQSLLNLKIFTLLLFVLKMSVAAAVSQQRKLEKSLQSSVTKLKGEIKERKRIENILIENENLLKLREANYKNIFETAGVSIWVQDFSEVKNLIDELKEKGVKNFKNYFDVNNDIVKKALSMVKIIDVNEQTLKLFKAKSKDELLRSLNDVFLPETLEAFKEELITIAEGRTYLEAETVEKNLDGEKIDILFTIRFPLEKKDFSNVLVSIMDITERKKAEEKIQDSLKEKEVLIKEIHHRVKNNLQIVSSLLNLQYTRHHSEDLSDYFITSRNRIRSIAVVHEMLYKNDNLSEIDFSSYISQLSSLVLDSYSKKNINININAENISFDIDTTVNLGLVTNEIITNSIKHAFKENKEGIINIKLDKQNDLCSLSISDNGIGLPKSFDINNTRTLGVHLISGLVSQIQGKLEIRNRVGTEFFITFEA